MTHKPAYLVLVLLFLSCGRTHTDIYRDMPLLFPSPKTATLDTLKGYQVNQATGDSIDPLVNFAGDTMVTGRAFPVSGEFMRKGLPDPLVVPAGRADVVLAHPNTYPVEKLRFQPLPGNISRRHAFPWDSAGFIRVSPVGDTLLTGVPLVIEGKTVRCRQPVPFRALPPGIQDEAIREIRFLDEYHGMSSSNATCLMKDSRGYMWFGTNGGGICRYDGITFTSYTTKEGLSGNVISGMIEDRHGNLWISTYEGGVTKYDGLYFTQYTVREGFTGNDVRSLLEDRQGNLWFVVYGVSVDRFDGTAFTRFTPREGFPNTFLFSIMEDSNGEIWVGHIGGAMRYDGVTFTDYFEQQGHVYPGIISIAENHNSEVWLSSAYSRIISVIKGDSVAFFNPPEAIQTRIVGSIIEDSDGGMCFATSGGLSRIRDGELTQYSAREGLSRENINGLLDDGGGKLWAGTGGGGVNIISRKGFEYFDRGSGLPDDGVSSFSEDKQGNVWIGINGAGLCRYDGNTFTTYTENEGLSSNLVTTLYTDSEGRLWSGTWNNGVTMYDGSTFWQFTGKDKGYDFNDIFEDSRGRFWFCTADAVFMYDGENYTKFSDRTGFCKNDYREGMEDSQGNLWFCSLGGGLTRFDGTRFTHFTEREGLSGNRVSSVIQDRSGRIWAGTWGGGVSIFNGSEFTYLTEREGLSSNYVRTLLEDSRGNVWITTLKGINLVVPGQGGAPGSGPEAVVTGKIIKYTNHQAFNPLIYAFDDHDLKFSGARYSVYEDRENRIWWGGGNGIVRLDLRSFILPGDPPGHVGINRLDLDGRFMDYFNLPNSVAEKVKFDSVARFSNYPLAAVFPYRYNHLTFHLSAIDWQAPHKIQFSYLLEGFDRGWSIPSPEPVADYRKLPQGKYTLHVRATGIAQKWSEPFVYSFRVKAPWWFSRVAFTLYALALLGLVLLYRRFLLKRAELRTAFEVGRIEKEKAVELNRMKSRFFVNISHEFRTPLTLILGPIEDLMKRNQKKLLLKREEAGILHRNASRLLQLINQILDISKLETGNMKLQVSEGDMADFIKRIVLSFISLAESRSISYTCDLPASGGREWFDRDKLEKILTNLLSNAFKFTPLGGEIRVTLAFLFVEGEKNPSSAEICVADSGRGIPAGQAEKIFDRFYQASSDDNREYEGTGIGLSLCRELVDLCRGRITVESEPGKGSVFRVTLPVSREGFSAEELSVEGTEETDGTGTLIPGTAPGPDDGQELHSIHPAHEGLDLPVVLVVEDNADLRYYIVTNLNDEYRILEAENGKAGYETALGAIPDLVITDLMMPEMDGIELCGKIRKDPVTNHIPVIILTARADKESRLEGLETGADDFLVKPFDADELRARVAGLIRQRRLLREKFLAEFTKDDPVTIPVTGLQDDFMARVIECIQKHIGEGEYGVEELSGEVGFSRSQLHRKISSLTGMVPNRLIRNIRLRQAARMFREGHTNITQVLYTVGFNSPSLFAKQFRELFGVNPSDYLRR